MVAIHPLWVDAESMGSLVEAAGKLQVGIFASGPLQEAALLQNAALQVCVSSNSNLIPYAELSCLGKHVVCHTLSCCAVNCIPAACCPCVDGGKICTRHHCLACIQHNVS